MLQGYLISIHFLQEIQRAKNVGYKRMYEMPGYKFVEPEVHLMYLAETKVDIDFTRPKFNQSQIVERFGFESRNETRSEKWGMIATTEGARLSVNIGFTNVLIITYLTTYVNIGGSNIWISESANSHGCKMKGKKLESTIQANET